MEGDGCSGNGSWEGAPPCTPQRPRKGRHPATTPTNRAHEHRGAGKRGTEIRTDRTSKRLDRTELRATQHQRMDFQKVLSEGTAAFMKNIQTSSLLALELSAPLKVEETVSMSLPFMNTLTFSISTSRTRVRTEVPTGSHRAGCATAGQRRAFAGRTERGILSDFRKVQC